MNWCLLIPVSAVASVRGRASPGLPFPFAIGFEFILELAEAFLPFFFLLLRSLPVLGPRFLLLRQFASELGGRIFDLNDLETGGDTG